MFESLLEVGQSLLPVTVTLLGAVVIVSLTARVLATRAENMSRAGRQIITVLVAALGLIAVVLTLPVDVETRNQLLGLLGLVVTALVTVSSTTFASNALAGFMLRGTRRYKPGDFIAVDGFFGRVASQGLFQTEVQTEDSDIVILPNLTLATNPVKVVRASGTIVSIELSLAYDAPRDVIKDALVTAAESTELEEPFVQLQELGDFSVTYRIAGFLREVKELPSVRSRLRAAAMDALHSAGIEIVSPTFMNQRALDPLAKVMPHAAPVGDDPKAPHAAPAELAFAEAEAASQVEAAREEMQQLEQSIDQLRKQRKEAGAEDHESLDAELERLGTRLTYLRERVNSD